MEPTSVEIALNGLPQSSKWLFPEYDFAQMEPDTYVTIIIERILSRGTWAEIRWLLNQYGKPTIAAWVERYGYRRLDAKAFHYWRWVLGVDNFQVPVWERKQ